MPAGGLHSTAPGGGSGDAAIAEDFQEHKSNVSVSGRGTVIKMLPDAFGEARHQKFLLRLDSGQTILVAHNIDIAGRVEGLKEGDAVEFSGEYVWDPQGGVVHWTHHDPEGRHAPGWLRHDGHFYQ